MPVKTLKGTVVSDKMQSTVVVRVDTLRHHPRYHKRYRLTKRFKADNRIGAREGDAVEITECPPVSKGKCWKVSKIIS